MPMRPVDRSKLPEFLQMLVAPFPHDDDELEADANNGNLPVFLHFTLKSLIYSL